MAVVGLSVGAASGLVSLAMILRFFWLVYDRGGPDDLAAAAKAVQQVHDPNWAAKLSRFLPSSSSSEDASEPSNRDDEASRDDDPTDTTAIAA